MGFNPFFTQGGVVPKGTKPRVVDQSNLIIYNMLMQRYYNVGRDYSSGLISKSTAKFQFEDIVIQLTELRTKMMENSLRKQIEALLARVQSSVEHIDEDPSSHL